MELMNQEQHGAWTVILVSVFVLPPSASELERRLHARAQDSAEVIAGRFARASGWRWAGSPSPAQ